MADVTETLLPIPIAKNYKGSWGNRTMTLPQLVEAVRGPAPTLSERLPPGAMIKPYIDIDRKNVPAAEFAAVDAQTRADWEERLRPLCSDLAVCTRS